MRKPRHPQPPLVIRQKPRLFRTKLRSCCAASARPSQILLTARAKAEQPHNRRSKPRRSHSNRSRSSLPRNPPLLKQRFSLRPNKLLFSQFLPQQLQFHRRNSRPPLLLPSGLFLRARQSQSLLALFRLRPEQSRHLVPALHRQFQGALACQEPLLQFNKRPPRLQSRHQRRRRQQQGPSQAWLPELIRAKSSRLA
jgi:hypothetical protein